MSAATLTVNVDARAAARYTRLAARSLRARVAAYVGLAFVLGLALGLCACSGTVETDNTPWGKASIRTEAKPPPPIYSRSSRSTSTKPPPPAPEVEETECESGVCGVPAR